MRDMQVWPRHVAKRRDEQTQADRYGVILDKLAAQADGYGELLQALFSQASGPEHASGALRGHMGPRGRGRSHRHGRRDAASAHRGDRPLTPGYRCW
jgi:hypothetical protein